MLPILPNLFVKFLLSFEMNKLDDLIVKMVRAKLRKRPRPGQTHPLLCFILIHLFSSKADFVIVAIMTVGT